MSEKPENWLKHTGDMEMYLNGTAEMCGSYLLHFGMLDSGIMVLVGQRSQKHKEVASCRHLSLTGALVNIETVFLLNSRMEKRNGDKNVYSSI